MSGCIGGGIGRFGVIGSIGGRTDGFKGIGCIGGRTGRFGGIDPARRIGNKDKENIQLFIIGVHHYRDNIIIYNF